MSKQRSVLPEILPGERWKAIPGWEGMYEVSDHGRMKSMSRQVLTSGGRRRAHEGRILVRSPNHAGYIPALLSLDGVKEVDLVHRLVLLAFIGPCPDGMECRHLDGEKTNNRIGNLAWGTRAENQADRVLHGTGNTGSRHGMSKLDELSVRIIRRIDGMTQLEIGMVFGVSIPTVSSIRAGLSWSHVVQSEVAR